MMPEKSATATVRRWVTIDDATEWLVAACPGTLEITHVASIELDARGMWQVSVYPRRGAPLEPVAVRTGKRLARKALLHWLDHGTVTPASAASDAAPDTFAVKGPTRPVRRDTTAQPYGDAPQEQLTDEARCILINAEPHTGGRIGIYSGTDGDEAIEQLTRLKLITPKLRLTRVGAEAATRAQEEYFTRH